MEKLSVGTEVEDLYIARRGGLKFKVSEMGVDAFHLKTLGIVKTMKQTKRYSV
jgi:hypothetical protein